MKKFLISIFIAGSIFAQSYQAYRTVFVSPNYPNVYPAYSTLQQVWGAIKDSASVSTGKYFTVLLITSPNNISDYGGSYKDSILNRYPYMDLFLYGRSTTDSLIGADPNQFNIAGGVLYLDPVTAGNGLTFSSDKYSIVTQNYLGNALYLDGDSLKLRINSSLEFTPNLLGVNLKYNNGIISDTGGIGVQTVAPLKTIGDNVYLWHASPLEVSNDTLFLDVNTEQFTIIPTFFYTPSLNLLLDSGIVSATYGTKARIDHNRIVFDSQKQLTLPSTLAGTGLIWTADSLNVGLSYQFTGYNDSIWIDMNTRQFDLRYGESPSVNIALDSGMTYASSGATTGIKPKIDYSTLIFNSLLQLAVNPTLAGGGLLMTAGVIGIVPNDFAKVENDTLKIKTSSVLTWFGDSLNSTIFYVPPYDTLGIGMFAKGNIKRVAINYVTDNGNDTTVMNFLDASWNAYDRIALVWDNSQMKFKIYKNKVLWQTLAGCANMTSPYKKDWNVDMETYMEAQ